jgi:hypothetical protein
MNGTERLRTRFWKGLGNRLAAFLRWISRGHERSPICTS